MWHGMRSPGAAATPSPVLHDPPLTAHRCCLHFSSCLQEFLQDFSWAAADMPADLRRRNQRLLASEAAAEEQQARRGGGGGAWPGSWLACRRRLCVPRAAAPLPPAVCLASFTPPPAVAQEPFGEAVGVVNAAVARGVGLITPRAADGGKPLSVEARLAHEPMFCLETGARRRGSHSAAGPGRPASRLDAPVCAPAPTARRRSPLAPLLSHGGAAVRLFYWARLAYRKEPGLDYKLINITHGLTLFDLEHYECIDVAESGALR